MVECETCTWAQRATVDVTGKHTVKKKKKKKALKKISLGPDHLGLFIIWLPNLNKHVKDAAFEKSLVDTFP